MVIGLAAIKEILIKMTDARQLRQTMVIINMGKEDLKIDEDLMSVKKVAELRKRIKKVHQEYFDNIKELGSKVVKLNEEYEELRKKKVNEDGSEAETEEEWAERLKVLAEEQNKRLDEICPPTDNDDYYQFELAYKALEVLGDMFGQKQKVTKDNFEAAIWPKVKQELARILVSNGCDMGTLFLPPRLTE